MTEPGARKPASGFNRLLLVPLRARAHVAEKLGPGWAIAADVVILGGGLALVAALVFDVSGEERLGIFAGLFVLAAIVGVIIGAKRKTRPEQQNDTQP
jgi:hypothetical protein